MPPLGPPGTVLYSLLFSSLLHNVCNLYDSGNRNIHYCLLVICFQSKRGTRVRRLTGGTALKLAIRLFTRTHSLLRRCWWAQRDHMDAWHHPPEAQVVAASVTQSAPAQPRSFISVKDLSHYAYFSNWLGCKLDSHHSWDKNLTLLRSEGVWPSISVAPWLHHWFLCDINPRSHPSVAGVLF